VKHLDEQGVIHHTSKQIEAWAPYEDFILELQLDVQLSVEAEGYGATEDYF
jgi:hypothetical protein